METTRAVLALALWVTSTLLSAQQSAPKKPAATPSPATQTPAAFGTSYSALRPEQKRLVDDLVRHYNATTGSNIVSQQTYDSARLSVRTTFDAVTHALLTTKVTDAQGESLGHAIDIVDAIDEVMGQEEGVGGD